MNAPSVFISAATLILSVSVILLAGLHAARLSSSAATRHFVLMGALLCVVLLPLAKFMTPFQTMLPLPMNQPSSVALSRNLQEAKLLSREFRWLVELLLAIWFLGASFLALQTAVAIRAVRMMIRRCSQSHDFALIDLASLAEKAGLNRSFELRVRRGRSFRSPLTWGIVRPVILLPRAAIHWNEDRLQAVLLHEMAHIRRHDCLSLLMARVACALFWFNPLVWRTARELDSAAEIAADDVAVSAGIKASSYAMELTAIAAEMSGHPMPSWGPALAIASESGLEARVGAILDPANGRDGVTGRWVVCLPLTALLTVITLAGLKPTFADVRQPHSANHHIDARETQQARTHTGRRAE